MSEFLQAAPGRFSLAYDGTLTFAGVLQKYFSEFRGRPGENTGISRNWDDSTKIRYLSDYNNRLLPVMERLFGAQKPIHEYFEEDFDAVIKELDKRYGYMESTKAHYRHLLWSVYSAGVMRGLYPDNIYWGELPDPKQGEGGRIETMTRLRKSFSVNEEIKLMGWFHSLQPETAGGEDIGLLLMFFMGLRNNEACGANYAGIYPMEKYSDMPVFDMLQSTGSGKNILKSGGKTSNAPRILPVFRPLYDFLLKRREHIEGLIQSGAIVLPDTITNIDQVPIVCRKNEYCVRASSRELSVSGRALFERIGVSKRELGHIHSILMQDEFRLLEPEEKEPTAYLFRRNFATHLYRMGFDPSEMQYMMGHEIEDPSISRNSFVNPDKLYAIGLRMKAHPWYALTGGSISDTVEIDADNRFYNAGLTEDTHITINAADLNERYMLSVNAREPARTIEFHLSGGRGLKCSGHIRQHKPDARRTVCIDAKEWSVYTEKLNANKL